MADPPNAGLTLVGRLTRRRLLRCVEWMEAHDAHVDVEIWEEVRDTMLHANSRRTRLIAARVLADRLDPVPRGPVIVNAPTTVSVTWQESLSSSPSPTLPAPSNGSYTVAFADGTASSPTDGSENPSSPSTTP